MLIFDPTVLLIALTTLIFMWGIIGFTSLGEEFKNNPMYEPTICSYVKAGPVVWLLLLYIAIYNFFIVK